MNVLTAASSADVRNEEKSDTQHLLLDMGRHPMTLYEGKEKEKKTPRRIQLQNVAKSD